MFANNPFLDGVEQQGYDNTRIVYNWAFGKHIMPLRYDWKIDTWYMSDGEPYTTTLILREWAQNE